MELKTIFIFNTFFAASTGEALHIVPEMWRIVANDAYSVFVDTQKTVFVIRWFQKLFFAIFILVEVKDFEAFLVLRLALLQCLNVKKEE